MYIFSGNEMGLETIINAFASEVDKLASEYYHFIKKMQSEMNSMTMLGLRYIS